MAMFQHRGNVLSVAASNHDFYYDSPSETASLASDDQQPFDFGIDMRNALRDKINMAFTNHLVEKDTKTMEPVTLLTAPFSDAFVQEYDNLKQRPWPPYSMAQHQGNLAAAPFTDRPLVDELLQIGPPPGLTAGPSPLPIVPRHAVTRRQKFDSVSSSEFSSPTNSPTNQLMLLVNKLPRCAGENEVQAAFEQIGNVTMTRIMREPNGTSKCYGFVHFSTLQEAQQALYQCEKGRVILNDEKGKAWYVKAEPAKGNPRKQKRRTENKQTAYRVGPRQL